MPRKVGVQSGVRAKPKRLSRPKSNIRKWSRLKKLMPVRNFSFPNRRSIHFLGDRTEISGATIKYRKMNRLRRALHDPPTHVSSFAAANCSDTHGDLTEATG